jgi:hypothetical protein
VIPRDLPRVAQATAGTKITFEFVSLEQAIALEIQHRRDIKALPGQVTALIRDPATIKDLLSYQMVGGMTSATDNPFEKDT